MASTFVTRLKVGEVLVDAKGVSRLVNQRVGLAPLIAFAARRHGGDRRRDPRLAGASQRDRLARCAGSRARSGSDLAAPLCDTPPVFDFRYHVASLIAVFIALVIGILVGIGLSGTGFVSDAERKNLENQISELTNDRRRRPIPARGCDQSPGGDRPLRRSDVSRARSRAGSTRSASRSSSSAPSTRPSTPPSRRRIRAAGGRSCGCVRSGFRSTSRRSSGSSRSDRRCSAYAGADRLRDLGHDDRRRARDGREDPAARRARRRLLEEREGGGQAPVRRRRRQPPGAAAARADARVPDGPLQRVSPTRASRPSASSGAPAASSAIKAFSRGGLSTVDSIETSAGRLALVLELAGAGVGALRSRGDGDERSSPARRAADGPNGRVAVSERLTVLVAARDEEERIGATVAALRDAFPDAEIVVADDGSGDATAARAEAAGARVVRLPRARKGTGSHARRERGRRPGPLLLCDADSAGDLRPLLASGADLAVAAFRTA